MKTVYLVVGVPGSGKSWVCNQLKDQFDYVPHDLYPKGYIEAIQEYSKIALKPLLIETPFSVSKIVEPLTAKGFEVTPVFIIETVDVTSERYLKREGKPIPQGHLTRIATYIQRAIDLNAVWGTSEEVLTYLKGIKQ
jgi:predicted ABC-type ATPase